MVFRSNPPLCSPLLLNALSTFPIPFPFSLPTESIYNCQCVQGQNHPQEGLGSLSGGPHSSTQLALLPMSCHWGWDF